MKKISPALLAALLLPLGATPVQAGDEGPNAVDQAIRAQRGLPQLARESCALKYRYQCWKLRPKWKWVKVGEHCSCQMK